MDLIAGFVTEKWRGATHPLSARTWVNRGEFLHFEPGVRRPRSRHWKCCRS